MEPPTSLSYRLRPVFKVFGVILLCVAALGLVYFMSLFGPQKVRQLPTERVETAEISAMEARSNELSATFERNIALREAQEEDFALLDEALQIEQKILALSAGHNTGAFERMERLQKTRDEHHAKHLREESLLAERAAAAASEPEEQVRQMELAWQLQDRINTDHSRSTSMNLLRAIRLKRDVEHLKSKPIHEASLAAEAASVQAQENQQWVQAVAKLEEAIALQQRLNEEFRGLPLSSPQRLGKLREQLDSLRAADLREQMLALEEQATQAQEAGEHQRLAAALDQLIRLQESVNSDFPDSRFASADVLNRLRQRRDEARSQSMAQLILDQTAQVDELLRARNTWKAAESVQLLSSQIDSFVQAFPESRLLGSELALKYRFLTAVRDDLNLLQDRLYGQLLPLPRQTHLRLLRTEVPQALYESVMLGTNPSRNRGPLLPVDSVNHDEAVEFGRRVGWLLGLPARLPTEAEFREALGRDRYARLADLSWNAENAEGHTHEIGTREPNSNGFYDLLGNVSEWLLSADIAAGREAFQAGGNIENTIDQLADVPVKIGNALGRNRFNGFRILVDTSALP